MKDKLNILQFFVLLFGIVVSPTAFAQEYNYHIPTFDSSDYCPNPMLAQMDESIHQLNTEYLDLRYNSSTEQLTLEVEFKNDRGKLPTGMHFGLSSGPMPKGINNIAKIYFDATSPNNIKVTAYTYNTVSENCGNYRKPTIFGVPYTFQMGSWVAYTPSDYTTDPEDPDSWVPLYEIYPELLGAHPIFASGSDEVRAVVEKSSVDSVRSGVTYRKFRLVLDATIINSYTPYYPGTDENFVIPYAWDGAKFAENIGLWFYAVNSRDVAYNSSGLLSNYDVDSCYICDFGDAVTNLSPSCDSVVPSSDVVRPGEKITAVIKGRDPEGDQLKLNYSGLPAGASFDQADGSTLTPDSNKLVTVNFDWVPQIGVSGDYNVNVEFTQQYGINQAKVSCPLQFKVEGCTPTDWRETINGIDDQIDKQLVDHTINVLLHRIRKLRGKNTAKEKEIKQRADALGLEAWLTLSELQRSRVIRQNCGSDVAGCELIDTTKGSTKVVVLINELHAIASQLIPIYKKVLKREGFSVSEATRRWRPIQVRADRLKENALVSISSLPSTVFACEAA